MLPISFQKEFKRKILSQWEMVQSYNNLAIQAVLERYCVGCFKRAFFQRVVNNNLFEL